MIKAGEADLSEGRAELETHFDAPGTVLLELKWPMADKKEGRAIAGAVAAPEKNCPVRFAIGGFRGLLGSETAGTRGCFRRPGARGNRPWQDKRGVRKNQIPEYPRHTYSRAARASGAGWKIPRFAHRSMGGRLRPAAKLGDGLRRERLADVEHCAA